ncbi:IS982 family transposase [Spirosoma daeguense]
MLTEIYVDVDDFCKAKMTRIAKALHHCGAYKKVHPSQLTLSEVMTILVYYHLSPYKNFKAYYTRHVCQDLKRDFPDVVSYDRFVALIPRALIPLMLYLAYRCQRSLRTGIYYIDATPLAACHPKRAHQHRTLKGFAAWGKTSVGWFFGLKVHLLINHLGQIVHVRISNGSTHDAHPKLLFDLTNDVAGWVFGDKGYLLNVEKQAFVEYEGQVFFWAKPRQGMKAPELPLAAKRWAKKRSLIETVIGQTKGVCNLEHTRHRSACNAFVNVYASLVAYSFYERTPVANVDLSDRLLVAGESNWVLAA